MDIVSSDDAYTVTIELPGLKKDDVEISVQERVLTVSGKFKPDISIPTPSDPEGYPIEDTEDEEDQFIDVDNKNEKKKKRWGHFEGASSRQVQAGHRSPVMGRRGEGYQGFDGRRCPYDYLHEGPREQGEEGGDSVE